MTVKEVNHQKKQSSIESFFKKKQTLDDNHNKSFQIKEQYEERELQGDSEPKRQKLNDSTAAVVVVDLNASSSGTNGYHIQQSENRQSEIVDKEDNIKRQQQQQQREEEEYKEENEENEEQYYLALEKSTIPNDWYQLLESEFKSNYFKKIKSFLETQKRSNKTIYPPEPELYSFTDCPLDQVKVVILGQDPYHGPGQAHGLCFSVKKGVSIPPSLRNIYKELKNEFPDFKIPSHGFLLPWCAQGALLLNASLTVERSKPNSHANCGWQTLTDKIIRLVNQKCENVVFMFWGAFAQKKGSFIDKKKHLVLSSPHPSPFSADKGFFGNGHFKKANEYLNQKGRDEINWNCLD